MGQQELPTAAQVMMTEALPVLLMVLMQQDWSTPALQSWRLASAACWAKLFLLPFLLRLLAALPGAASPPEAVMRQQLL